MGAVLPLDIFGVGQPEESLVHKRGGLQRVTSTLSAELASRDFTQIRQ